MESEKVNATAGVPTVWLGLLQYLESNKLTLHHLKRVLIGGAAVPRAMIEGFEDRGIAVTYAWGMTEMYLVPQHERSQAAARRTAARATDRCSLQAGLSAVRGGNEDHRRQGLARARDGKSVGRLKVKGPAVARRYFKGEGEEAFDRDGWFDTGDVATLDADGFMHITDRSKDVIKSGGEWISTIEIENLAVGHPAVAEAAAIGGHIPNGANVPS